MITPVEIFSVPMAKMKARNQDKIKKYLMENVYPYFEKNGPNDKITNAYTDYVPGAVKAPWKMLSKFYEDDISEFLEYTGIDFSLGWTWKSTHWYGMMHTSNSQFVHDHTGGPTTIQWSAVHYVVLKEKTPGTVFVNPNSRMMKSVIPTKNRNYLPAMYYPTEKEILVEEGDIVFFPSWLDHHTPDHTNGDLRVVAPMNIMMKFDHIEGM